MLEINPICGFNDNYLWCLTTANSSDAIVVDPGDAELVARYLDEQCKTLSAIVITHHHWDHTDGVPALVERYQVPVYGPANCTFKGITHPLQDGQEIELLGQPFKVKAVPGHTLDHICYYSAQGAQLLCGDMLFLAGCGRVFEGSMQQMLTAMQFFKGLAAQTKVYATHEYSLANLAFAQAVEPENTAVADAITRCTHLRRQGLPTLPSSIAAECQHNPFLRTDNEALKATLEMRTASVLTDEVAVFSALRQWKDTF
ncbi:MAG: hydroxyacylglutathione hydrolase [Pseudomonadales bacterium]